MRERLMRFMAGRNGNDQLNVFLLIVDVVLLVLAGVLFKDRGSILYPLAVALLFYIYFRMFSRNLYKRRDENGKFLRLKHRIESRMRVRKEQWQQRKDYKFFTCPSCRAALRVPKGRGKLKIVCRKCGTSFFGKS